MLKMILLFVITFLSLITITNAQWIDRSGNLPASAGTGWAIDAVDSLNAVISINPGGTPPQCNIYKTTDGGETWEVILSQGSTICDLSMKSTNDIWMGDGSGRVQFTSNGGTIWVTQYYDPSKTDFINYIEMFDMNNGIAMGDALTAAGAAVFLKTNNGGGNWIVVNDSAFGGLSGDIWRRIDFIDLNTGYFYETGINPQAMFKTTTGCQSWHRTNLPAGFALIKFFDENVGIAGKVAVNQNIFRTIDGGTNWEIFTYSPARYVEDIEFLPTNSSKVWLADYFNLFFSGDTGKTWSIENVQAIDSLFARDIVFVDGKCGWLLCDGGKVYRTTNGDVISNNEKEYNLIIDFSLYQNYPNPFNPSTKISWQSPVGSHQTLKVYDVIGREVATIVDEFRDAGSYEVEFHSEAGNRKMACGVYYFQLRAGEFVETKKMILLK